MKETKTNILKASLELFNSQGFVNVRLQHIADAACVSIGNLAYHFETKKEILMALYRDIVRNQVELLNELNIVPLFENMDRHWDNVFDIQNRYSFFYQDILEILRFDAMIAEEYQKHILWEKEQYHRIFIFNISRGAFQFHGSDQDIREASFITWRLVNSWLQYAIISGLNDVNADNFKNSIWLSLAPYFTQTGRLEYNQLVRYKKIVF